MLTSIFENKEVKNLLVKISNNPRYYDKKKKDSINYEKFSGLEQPFFLIFDALFKYQIIIQDEAYFTEYVRNLELLWYKIDNFHDILEGISKILVKFCAKKLGYKNKIEEHRKEILEYIYNRYIVDGYFYHGVSHVYVDEIKRNGFNPQKYENYYSRFQALQEKHPAFFTDMDFNHDYVSFTDNFMMACYYAVYSPLYFSKFICPKTVKNVELNSYAKRDYLGCFQQLKTSLKAKDFKEDECEEIERVCNDNWKLLKQNEAVPTIMLVKRSYFKKNEINKIEEIIQNSDEDISIVASRIMDYKFDSFNWDKFIPQDDISFVFLPYSQYVVKKIEKEVEIILPTVSSEKDEDGKVSFLLLLGSSLILLGVLISILMLY